VNDIDSADPKFKKDEPTTKTEKDKEGG